MKAYRILTHPPTVVQTGKESGRTIVLIIPENSHSLILTVIDQSLQIERLEEPAQTIAARFRGHSNVEAIELDRPDIEEFLRLADTIPQFGQAIESAQTINPAVAA